LEPIVEKRITPPIAVYNSARLAEGYAFARPPVHPRVIELIAARLHITQPLDYALDVGCGAGRSTDALAPIANVAIGIDPVFTMLTHCHAVAPCAQFAVSLEPLPFADRSFDLITAAGSLNYADLDLFLPNAARVLKSNGTLVVYDFSAGRRFRDDDALDTWFAEFANRYPFQHGYKLDVRTLDYARFGLRFDAYHEFEIALPITASAYLRYVLSETNVERAIAHGESEDAIRDWCTRTIEEIFGTIAHDVLFTGYVAYVKLG
jgi:ubiquinone/menaquinone biosynthesis C-methylase UbiE